MGELSDFLLARFAEDEERAKRAAFGWGREWTDVTDDLEEWSTVHADGKRDMVGCEDRDVTRHIARHDPARVLAECEAKREIIRLHESWPVLAEGPVEFDPPDTTITGLTMRATRRMAWLTGQEYRARFGSEPPTTPMLRALALPYADHPDYDEEWRP